jgi:hemolysin activation/secretion protein
MSHTAHLRLSLFASVSLALCLSHSGAYAAGPNVDAGALLRQAEQEFKPTKSTKKRTRRKAVPTAAVRPTDTTVQVNTFTFKGNTLLSSDALQTALASFTNRPLTLAQLKEAADAITNTYREAGWTVRAYLPQQEINNGTVTLHVVEAVFGGASLSGAEPQRMDAQVLIDMAEASLGKGTHLHAAQLDRTLLLLDDLPGVNVSGNLVQGDNDGEINLDLAAMDDALVNGNASVDNQGSRATGPERLSMNLSINSPARMGDALAINALKTQGTEYQRLSYSVPMGFDGARVGVHASHLNYQVITPEFASLNPFGTAITRGLDVSYPLVRSQLQNVNLALSYDDKNFDNTSNGALTSYGIKVFNASLSASLIDNWEGGGVTNATASVTSGDKYTDARYKKYNFSLSRLQSVSDTLSVYVAASAQTTNATLDSSEKMYLGGATGVRAYPASEAGGSSGSTLTLELRQRLDNNLTLTGFYDYGRVQVNHDNAITSPANPNDYNLQGYGITLTWQAAPSADFKATLAQRMGSNPAANTTTGMDADGTQKITRIWLSTSIAY